MKNIVFFYFYGFRRGVERKNQERVSQCHIRWRWRRQFGQIYPRKRKVATKSEASTTKPSTTKASTSENAKKKPKCNENAKQVQSTPAVVRANVPKSNRKAKATSSPPPPPPPPTPTPLKSCEMEAEKMKKCSVVVLSMTENDITKEVERMKRQFKIDEVKKNVKKLDPFEMLEFTR